MSKRVMVDIMKVIGPHIIAMKRNFNVGKTHPTTSSKPQFHAWHYQTWEESQIEIDEFLQNTFL